jgi:hypothetical protein
MERVVAIKITSDGKAFVADQAANAAATGKLGAALETLGRQLQATDDASAKLEKTTQKLTAGQVAHIEKVQRLAETAGMTASELRRFEAAELGVSDALAASLAKIDAAEQATHKLSLANSGVTRELAIMGGEALRGNWTRLEGSMTVLANRTGLTQIAIAGLTSGVGLFTAGAAVSVGVVGLLEYQHEKLQRTLNAMEVQLTATGRASTFTTGELQTMLHELERMPGVTKETAAAAIESFTKTRDLGKEMFQKLTAGVADYAAATGEKLPEAASRLAKAFQDPAAGAKMLHEQLGILTYAEVLQIEEMTAHGDKLAAQRILYEALQEVTRGLAKDGTALQTATHNLGDAWDKLTHSMGESTAMRGVDALLVGIVNKFTWLIENGPGIERVLALIPGGGPALSTGVSAAKGIASLFGAGSTPTHTATVSGKVGDASGPAAGDDVATLQAHVDAAMKLAEANRSAAGQTAELKKQQDFLKQSLADATTLGLGPETKTVKDLRDGIAGLQERMSKAPSARDGINAAIEELKRQALVEEAAVKQNVANIQSLFKQGLISHMDAIRQEAAAELAGVDTREALLKRELAIAKTKANSLTEQNRIEGELAQLGQQRRNIEQTEVNQLDELETQVWAKSFDAYAKDLDAQQKSIDKTNERAAVIEQEISAHGKSAQAILQVANAHLQNRAAMMAGNDTYTEAIAKINEEIAANNRLIGDLNAKDAQTASDAAAKHAEEAFQQSDKRIQEGLYSAITDGIGSAGKRALKDLENWAAHTLLQIPVSMIGQAGASILNPGAASAGGGYSSLLSAASGGNSLFGNIGSAALAGYNGVGTATSIASLGGDAMGSAAGTLGAVDSAAASEALGLSATAEATTAATSGIATGIGAGVEAGLAAVPVVGWIALAGIALYSIFGGKGGGPKTEGGYAPNGIDISGIDIGGSQQGSQRGDVTSAKSISDAISTGLTGLGNEFGITLAKDIGVFYAKDPQGDSLTQLNVVSDNYSRSATEGGIENVGRSDAEFQAALAKATAQLDLTELAHALTGKIGDYLKALDPASLTTEQITAYIQIAANAKAMYNAFEQLGPAFKSTTDMTVTGMNDLVTAMGGIQNATAQLTDYDKNYYTATEQRAQIINNIVKTLGAAGMNFTADQVANATRNQFRALVESLDLTTDAGKKDFAALMSVEGALASVTAAATDTSMGLTTMHDQMIADIDSAAKALADARAAETKTISDQISALRSSSEQFHTFANDLRSFRDNLLLGSLSPLTPAQKYAEAQQQFEQTYQAAMSGDPAALAKLQQASTDFLQASQVYNASSAAYQHDFAEVQAALTLAATKSDAQATSADAQLVVLNAQLSATEQVNTSVLTVAQAIDNLAQAVSAAIGAGLNPGAANVGALTNGVTGQFVNTTAGSAYSSTAGAAALNGTIYAINGGSYTFDQARQYLGGLVAAGEPMQAYYAIKSAGITLAEADKLMGWSAMTAENWATANGLPIFHEGTNFVPKTGLALLERGEAVVPRAFNPGALSLGGNNALLARFDELVASNKALAAEVRSVKVQVASSAQEQIAHNYQANHQAAATVVNGTANAASRDTFVQRQADSARVLA